MLVPEPSQFSYLNFFDLIEFFCDFFAHIHEVFFAFDSQFAVESSYCYYWRTVRTLTEENVQFVEMEEDSEVEICRVLKGHLRITELYLL